MEPNEALERFEKAEEVSEQREQFGRRVAVLVAAVAAFLAIASLSGSRFAEEAILDQARASDAFNEYQANSLKLHINQDTISTLTILGKGTPNEAAAKASADKLAAADSTKYQPNKDRLLPKAMGYVDAQEGAESRHRVLQFSEAALQLAIVLLSISIITRLIALVFGAGAMAAAGIVLLVDGYILFWKF